mgnify:CR=1 FL=1
MARRVVYSIFVQPEFDEEGNHDSAHLDLFSLHSEKLIESKEQYTKNIGADWIFFQDLEKIQEFKEKFSIDTVYNAVNLYKIFMFEELSKKYDEVLYLDFDVVPKTRLNFFEEVDLSEKIWCLDQQDRIDEAHWKIFRNRRDPTLKYLHAKAITGLEHTTLNTAVLAGSSRVISNIGFMDKLPRYIEDTNNKKGCELYGIGDEISHNNEAFFSAAIEESGVEIQNEDRTWHYRVDHKALEPPSAYDFVEDLESAKFLHFINKNFGVYFGTVKRVVYSMNVVIPKELNDLAGKYMGDDIDKTERTTIEFEKWGDRLIANKKAYADHIGADYIHFEEDERYHAFRERCRKAVPDMSEYNVVNFYKIWLAYELTREGYDQVLYLDHDVVVNTKADFFMVFNLEIQACCNFAQEFKRNAYERAAALPRTQLPGFIYNFRSPDAKYWNCHAMLEEDGMEGKNNVYNTGIFAASRNILDRIGYFDDFEEVLDLMTRCKEDEFSMYQDAIRLSFGYDNETVFSYKVQVNEVPVYNLSTEYWHFKADHHYTGRVEELQKARPALYHMINKQFEDVKHAL